MAFAYIIYFVQYIKDWHQKMATTTTSFQPSGWPSAKSSSNRGSGAIKGFRERATDV